MIAQRLHVFLVIGLSVAMLPSISSAALIFSEDFESGWADGDPWFNSSSSVNGWTGESRDDAVSVKSAPSLANAPNLGSFYTELNDHDDPNAVVTIGNPANIAGRTETVFRMEWDMSALSYGGTDGSIHYFGFHSNLDSNNINGDMFGNVNSAMTASGWEFGFGGSSIPLGDWARVRLTIDTATGSESVLGEYNLYDSSGNLTTWTTMSGNGISGPNTGELPLEGIAFGHRDSGLTTAAPTQSQLAIDNIAVYAIPEPSAALLIALGLGGLALVRRRR